MAPKFKKKLTIHLAENVPQFMTRLIGAYCRGYVKQKAPVKIV
jgi:hypothetical protein